MRAWARFRRTPWSAVAAVLVLVIFALFFVAWMGLGEGEFGVEGGPEMTRSEFRSLTIGAPRAEVEEAVGRGQDALEFNRGSAATRGAVEPMNAACVYYFRTGAYSFAGPIQLCYRDNALVSKRLYS